MQNGVRPSGLSFLSSQVPVDARCLAPAAPVFAVAPDLGPGNGSTVPVVELHAGKLGIEVPSWAQQRPLVQGNSVIVRPLGDLFSLSFDERARRGVHFQKLAHC